jgi:hypothetical protein
MKRHFGIHGALTLALVSYLSTGAQGSPITFTYDWTTSVSSVSGQSNLNAIVFSNQGPNTVTANQVVGNTTSLSVENGTSDTFSNAVYNLTVKITDGINSGTMTFTGELNGKITNGVANNLTNTWIGPPGPVLSVGTDQFSVAMGQFVPPNPVGVANKPGGFGFEITAVGGSGTLPPPNDVPEPTTLLLSCLGAGGFGLRLLRKRQS